MITVHVIKILKALNGESCQDGVCNDSLIGNDQPYSFAAFQTLRPNNSTSTAVFYDDSATLDTAKDVTLGQPTSANLYLYIDGTPFDTIPGATVNIGGGGNDFVIPNPSLGNYTLSLSGEQAGTVTLTIGYDSGVDSSVPSTRVMRIYHKTGVQVISFAAQP